MLFPLRSDTRPLAELRRRGLARQILMNAVRLDPSSLGRHAAKPQPRERLMRSSLLHQEPGASNPLRKGASAVRFFAAAAIAVAAAGPVARAAAPATPQGVITGKGFLNI